MNEPNEKHLKETRRFQVEVKAEQTRKALEKKAEKLREKIRTTRNKISGLESELDFQIYHLANLEAEEINTACLLEALKPEKVLDFIP
jgi:hypothetical protein